MRYAGYFADSGLHCNPDGPTPAVPGTFLPLNGEGANRPFLSALSRHIGIPGLEVQQMLTRVRAEVVAATKSRQLPWSNSSLLGEVYLAEK